MTNNFKHRHAARFMHAALAIETDWRNVMSHWIDKLQLTADDSTFAMAEVNALIGILAERGIGKAAVLGAAQIDPSALTDTECKITLKQQCRAQKAAEDLCREPGLMSQLARRLHLTTYGIAGYALLSSPNLGEAARVAELYSPLLNLKFSLSLREEWPNVRLCLTDRYVMDEDMRRSCLTLELAKVATLLRDVLGDDFKPHGARCAAANSSELDVLSEILGCSVHASSDTTEISFDAALLQQPLPLSHTGTHAACLRVCDAMMTGLASRFDLVRHIKELILKATGRPPALPELAQELCVSQRTLRRRLVVLNTSYNRILEEVRKELAVRYLTTTQYTTEDIAQLIGYSEAANFRHAFKRWTGAAPSSFRASHCIAAAAAHSPAHAGYATAHKSGASSHHRLLNESSASWG